MATDPTKNRMHVFKNTGKDADVSTGVGGPAGEHRGRPSLANRPVSRCVSGDAQAAQRGDCGAEEEQAGRDAAEETERACRAVYGRRRGPSRDRPRSARRAGCRRPTAGRAARRRAAVSQAAVVREEPAHRRTDRCRHPARAGALSGPRRLRGATVRRGLGAHQHSVRHIRTDQQSGPGGRGAHVPATATVSARERVRAGCVGARQHYRGRARAARLCHRDGCGATTAHICEARNIHIVPA